MSSTVCHFYNGMPLHKRVQVLALVADWVECAWVLGAPFAVVLGARGVVRIASKRWSERDFAQAYEGAGLIGVFLPGSSLFANLDVRGAVDVVLSDVLFALEGAGL